MAVLMKKKCNKTVRSIARALFTSGKNRKISFFVFEKAQNIIKFVIVMILKLLTKLRVVQFGLESDYSLTQNCWDTFVSPCPLNVGVQGLVTEPR